MVGMNPRETKCTLTPTQTLPHKAWLVRMDGRQTGCFQYTPENICFWWGWGVGGGVCINI